jgi:hypothetical protein
MSRNEHKESEFITKSTLKERGWTDLLIKIFLPKPHETRQNPNYRSGPPMCLYKITAVEETERSDDFQKMMIEAQKRKQGAKKAVETKLADLRRQLNTMEFKVPHLSEESLLKHAIGHYNEMQDWRESNGFKTCGRRADEKSDIEFLNRIQVNYLRHCLTSYEEKLDEIAGRVGFAEGYVDIRKKIFIEIARLYPWLEDECKRQCPVAFGLDIQEEVL